MDAQQFQSIPDSNATWIIEQDDGWGGSYFHKLILSKTKNDTIINSSSYIKVFGASDSLESNYIGAFRNDTNGKSYYVPNYSQEEYLLRDFSKITGDTLRNVAYSITIWDIWNLDFHIDSLAYVTSGPHTYKVIYLNTIIEDTIPEVPPNEPLVWMEKIGSSGGGILNSYIGALGAKRLYCMQNNDTIFYDSGPWWFVTDNIVYELGECPYPVNIDENSELSSMVKLFPNPFITSTTIKYQLDHPSEVTISIFNSFGEQVELIRQKQSQGKQQVVWNAEGLPSGIYFFTLKAGEQVASGKLVLMR